MRDALPQKIRNKESGIINLQKHNEPGSHWVSYFKKGDNITYFDSFGNLKPPVEVSKYFNSNGCVKVYYNYDKYQNYNSFNCGHLCLMFLSKNL